MLWPAHGGGGPHGTAATREEAVVPLEHPPFGHDSSFLDADQELTAQLVDEAGELGDGRVFLSRSGYFVGFMIVFLGKLRMVLRVDKPGFFFHRHRAWVRRAG